MFGQTLSFWDDIVEISEPGCLVVTMLDDHWFVMLVMIPTADMIPSTAIFC